jgi:hypothetical protein
MLNQKNLSILFLTILISLGCQKKMEEKIYLSCKGVHKVYEKDDPYKLKPRDESLTLTIEHKVNPQKTRWDIESGNLILMLGFFPIDMRDEKTKEGQVISTNVTDTEIQGKDFSKYDDGTRGYRVLTINRINGEINYETEIYLPKSRETYRSEYKGLCEVSKKI